MRREPQYEHDCDQCVYLSDYQDGELDCDLYYCPQGETLIARFSSDGPDYLSCPPEIVSGARWLSPTGSLRVALRRAMELGLVKICPETTSPTRTNFIPTMDGGKGDGRCGGTRRD